MPYAIIREKNGRRHEVDFGDASVRVEIHSSEETVAHCQVKQLLREIRSAVTVGNPGDPCTGCNLSWCPKRKLDNARLTPARRAAGA
jgi:hypothetical protein